MGKGSYIASPKQVKALELGRKKKWTPEMRKKLRIANLGKKLSTETKEKISLYNLQNPRKYWLGKHRENMMGDKNPSWKGGTTNANQKIRNSVEYALWRTAVFVRDNYTCQNCNKYGEKLNADHIKPFALYPELRLAIDNGRTLCEACHKETDTYLNRWIGRLK